MKKITITGLSKDTTENNLREAFFKYGEITNIKIPLDKKSNKSKGIGFITFQTTEGSSSAAMEMDGEELDGKEITITIPTGR